MRKFFCLINMKIFLIIMLIVSFWTLTIGTYMVNYHLYTDMIQILRFGDYRSKEQRAWQNETRINYADTILNKEKRVILLAFDGLVFEIFKEHTLDNDFRSKLESNEIYNREFSSPAYETIVAFRNIFGGYKYKTPFNMFNIIENSKSQLKTSAQITWNTLLTKSLDYNTKISGLINYTKEKGERNSNQYMNKNIDDAKTILNIQYEDFYKKIDSEKYNLMFFYEYMVDNAGHLGLGFNSEYVREIYKHYFVIISRLFEQYGDDPNTLILITTDHGQSKSGINHDFWDKSAYRSFFVSSHDLNQIVGRDWTNQIDTIQIVYDFLKQF